MRRVVVTGLGVVSPVGNNVDTFWKNLCDGVCGLDFIKSFPTEDLQSKIAGEIKDFKPSDYDMPNPFVRKQDKFTLYAMAAAWQAMRQSGLNAGEDGNIDPFRLGVYIGSGIGGFNTLVRETEKIMTEGPKWVSPNFIPTMIGNMAMGNVAIKYNACGPCLSMATACVTSTHTIGEAFKAIKHGYADAIIAGGAEACVTPLGIAGFANAKALSRSEEPNYASLPFNKNRGGFVMSEGAAVLVLEEYERAVERGAEILAEVVGYGNTCDAYHVTAPRPGGLTQSAAIKMALDEGGYTSDDVLYINAHGTSTHFNDLYETMAIQRVFGEDTKVAISSTKSMTGHLLGGAGGIEAVAVAKVVEEDFVPPTIGYEHPDEECPLDYVPNTGRNQKVRYQPR